jgi:hypothetical protein
MSLPTNPERCSFPIYQLAAHDFEAGAQAKSIRSTQPIPTENRHCISFPRKPYDQVEEAKFNSSKGNWHWDIRTDTTVWSEQLYRMIGRENGTIPPFKEHFRFYTSESWIRLVDATLKLLQTGTPYELTLQMLHADGGRRWVIRNGEAASDERGDILELRGTVDEISEWMALVGNSEENCRTRSIAEDTIGRLIQAQEEGNAKLAIELRASICQRVSLLAAQIESSRSTFQTYLHKGRRNSSCSGKRQRRYLQNWTEYRIGCTLSLSISFSCRQPWDAFAGNSPGSTAFLSSTVVPMYSPIAWTSNAYSFYTAFWRRFWQTL